MKESYFIIFFVGENSSGMVYGNVAFAYTSIFPNRAETEQTICKSYNVKKCIITNLIRVSELEYNEWCRK